MIVSPEAVRTMLPWLGALAVSWLATAASAPVLRAVAARRGLVDAPDGARKLHGRAVPVLGGAAILIGVVGGLAAAVAWVALLRANGADPAGAPAFPWTVVLGCVVITVTGLVDDLWGVIPRIKIGGQLIAAAALAYQSDLGSSLAADACAFLGVSPPAWVIYALGSVALALLIVGGCNAMNLLDGLDGLATGVAGIAAVGLLIVCAVASGGVLTGEAVMSAEDEAAMVAPALLALVTLGACAGFLPLNRAPAKMFLGDAGSLLLGFLLVAVVLSLAKRSDHGIAPVLAGLIVVALPCADTALAIVRRAVARRWITTPDRLHLHHLLLARGLSERAAAAALMSAALWFASLGALTASLTPGRAAAVFAAVYGAISVAAVVGGARQARGLRAAR